jgi:hypothetical protein
MGDLIKGADTALNFLATMSDSVVRAANSTAASPHTPPAAAPAPDRTPPPASPSSSREQTPDAAAVAADPPQSPPQTPGRCRDKLLLLLLPASSRARRATAEHRAHSTQHASQEREGWARGALMAC